MVKKGIIKEPLTSKGRFAVRFYVESKDGNGVPSESVKLLSVKPDNLKLVEHMDFDVK